MDIEGKITNIDATNLELSSIEQEYLSAIRHLLQEKETVRIIDVANKLGHDRSKAHYWVKKLSDRGIVETVPKKGVITLLK